MSKSYLTIAQASAKLGLAGGGTSWIEKSELMGIGNVDTSLLTKYGNADFVVDDDIKIGVEFPPKNWTVNWEGLLIAKEWIYSGTQIRRGHYVNGAVIKQHGNLPELSVIMAINSGWTQIHCDGYPGCRDKKVMFKIGERIYLSQMESTATGIINYLVYTGNPGMDFSATRSDFFNWLGTKIGVQMTLDMYWY